MTEQRNLARFATIANAAFNSMTANSTAITSMSIGGHTINATSFAGTANNANNLGGIAAASYQLNSALAANVATMTANNATNLGGVAAASYQLNSTLAANVATLTSNNTSFVGTVTAANVVSNAQLSANLANYQTTAGLSANVATLTANNASFLGGTAAASFQLNSTLSANVATMTANNTTFISGNNVLTVMQSLRANRNLTGGGTISVDGSGNVRWTNRFIVISNGRGSHFSTNGYFDINCPTSGTITGVGGAANKTATAAGIPVGAWEALYYILPVGSGEGTVAANFRVASYVADLEVPSNWLLICVVNGDEGNWYFNNGVVLKAGQSYVSSTYSSTFYANAANITTGTLPDARLSSSVVLTSGTQAITGAKQFNTDNVSIANSTGGLARLEATGTGGAAFMSFHRPGAFAAYFGIDSDNVWKVGGWSYGAAAFTVLHSGNFSSFTANNSTNLNGQAASFYTNASNLSTGTVPTARLGSGTANTTTFLRGDQTWGTAGGGQIQDQLFTSSGSWTVPAGVTRVRVLVIGGGGGGSWYGTSGGSGGIARGTYTVTPGNVITVTVGAGGNGITSNGTAPSGGTSSFGAFVSATGGGGGFAGGGPPQGGAAGAGSGGTVITGLSVSVVGSPFGANLVRTTRTAAAISWNTNVAFSPGAGGERGQSDSYSGALLNNPTGGVGGIVYIEWVG